MGVRKVADARRADARPREERVITCPDCHAENELDATECQSCGRALPQPEAANAPLPQWLQQLKPEAEVEEPLEVKTPVGAASASMLGTDSVISSKPPSARRAKRESEAEKGAGQSNMTETASLISEDDLPAWLRAFGDAESKQQATASTDESWMVGAEAEGAANVAAAQNLAQSWQSPTQPAASRARTGAASIFAKPSDGPARPERVIAAAPTPVVAEPEPEALARPSGGRSELPRPVPTSRERSGVSLQRVALVAFVAALLIFLIVVGIFLIGPTFG